MGPGERGLKYLIVTADDFGAAREVNEAVEQAHRDGILTTTSLMISASEAEDAVRRARELPTLGVGLHVVVVRGRSTLPATDIPSIADTNGQLPVDLVKAGFKFFFSPAARRDLRKEIAAQFDTFDGTGLALDHANSHNHMHLHPTVLSIMIEEGKKRGLKAIRLPRPKVRGLSSLLLLPWIWLCRRKIVGAGLVHNDILLGLDETGHLNAGTMISEIEGMPDGICEFMTHPAVSDFRGREAEAEGYEFETEFAALMDPAVRDAVTSSGATTIRFQDIR